MKGTPDLPSFVDADRMENIRAYLEARSSLLPNGCRVWNVAKNDKGYGVCGYDGKRYYAHRLSYQDAKGEIPKGAVILHRCDNPACINPDHLTADSQAANVADMLTKGRGNLRRQS